MRKALRISARILAVLAVIVIVAGGVFAWRLSQGPIEVGFLTPYLENAFNSGDDGIRVRTKTTVIAWAGRGRGIELQARDLRIDHKNGQPLAEVPVLSVRLSLRALVTGEIAPIEVTVQQPQLFLERSAEGRVSLGLSSKPSRGSKFVPGLLNALVRERRNEGPLRLLTTVRIERAELSIDDRYLGRVWRSRNLTVEVSREGQAVKSKMSFDLTVGDETVRFDAHGNYDIKSGVIGLDLIFKRLDPAMFASARGGLRALAWFKMPVGGRFRLSIVGSRITSADFDLNGRDGAIAIPGYYDQPLDLTRFKARGRVLDEGRRLRIEAFEADFHGTKVTISGVFSGLDSALGFGGSVAIEALPVDDIARFWPRQLKANARNWVAQNIRGGLVRSLELRLEMKQSGPQKELEVGKLHGAFRYTGMNVRFQRLLPPIKKVAGFATFSEKDLRFTIEDGDLEGIQVVRARVDLVEFDKPVQSIEIEAQIAGKLSDVLTVLDRKPLQFARRLGINPLAVSATTNATIRTGFVLRKEVAVDDINITAKATIQDLEWRKGAFGQDLSRGRFTLDVSKNGMILDGNTLLGGVQTKLRWEEFFGDKVKQRNRFDIKTMVTPAALKRMGLDVSEVIKGPIGTTLEVAGYDGGRKVISGTFDLTRAELTVPIFGTRKPAGMPATAKAVFQVGATRLRRIEGIQLTSRAVQIKGSASFHADGETLKELKIDRLKTGRTQLAAQISGTAKGAKSGRINGTSLDVPAILKHRKTSDDGATPPLNIRASFRRVYFGRTQYVDRLKGELRYDGAHITRMIMNAAVPRGRPIDIRLTTIGRGRNLVVRTDDAGAALRALSLIDTLKGGRLRVNASSRSPTAPISGLATLTNYRVAKAPVFARILALASLRGISNLTASDEGIAFSTAEVPFKLYRGRLTIENARAVGSQIGITISGDISLSRDFVAMNGTVVPAYTLNSMLGKLPLIGKALVGEKGSGVFAARYEVRGPLAKPALKVNPLSVLTPGFLRNIFGGAGPGRNAPINNRSAPGNGYFDHDKIGR